MPPCCCCGGGGGGGAGATQPGAQAEIQIKYDGYIQRQGRMVEKLAGLEAKLIPQNIDYKLVTGLRNEAKQKFAKFAPRSLGQALRISGITPADVTVLQIHLERSPR